MYKIDTAFSSPAGEWQEPDIVSGNPGTRFSADWMNALQQEILNVIAGAGLTPTKGLNNQLLQAIDVLVGGGGGGGGGGSPHWVAPVPTTGDLVPASLNGAICFTLDNKRLYYSNGTSWALLYDPSTIATLTSQMATRIPLTQKGAANGVAPLDASGKVNPTYLPGFVDDILEYSNLAGFPATGQPAKIYVALDTSKTYRWSGSTYTELVSSPGTTDAVVEGVANLYHTTARAAAVADTQIAGARGAVSGLAPLNSSQKIDSSYLPSYVDDVIEATSFSALPVSGEIGKIYITLDTNQIYRWSGTVYVNIVGSPGSTDSVTEGSTNKYFTDERAQDAVGAILTDSDSIAFSYDDTANTITAEIVGDIAGGLKPVALVTTSGTTLVNTSEPVNPVGTGGITRTLPASTAMGWSVVIYDVSGNCSAADFIRITPGAGDQLYIPKTGLTSDSLKLRRPNVKVTANQAAGSNVIYLEIESAPIYGPATITNPGLAQVSPTGLSLVSGAVKPTPIASTDLTAFSGISIDSGDMNPSLNYWAYTNGVVNLGLMVDVFSISGTPTTLSFTLPVSIPRPLATTVNACLLFLNSSIGTQGYMTVSTAGVATFYRLDGNTFPTSTNNGYIRAQMSWRAI